MTFKRRQFIQASAMSSALATLPSCRILRSIFSSAPYKRSGIDTHCHVFNSTDIPASEFVRRVILREYDTEIVLPGPVVPRESFKADIAELIIKILQRGTITARAEIEALDGGRPVSNRTTAEEAATLNLILQEARNELPRSTNRPPPVIGIDGGLNTLVSRDLPAELLDQGLLREEDVNQEEGLVLEAIALAALLSNGPIGRNIRWAFNLTKSRLSLTEQLLDLYGGEGGINLFTPAMVDYDYWLDEKPISNFSDQVDVMDRIQRYQAGPSLVHSFVGFNPLHQVVWEESGSQEEEPLKLVDRAILTAGFLGVKMYPPMGFLPANNAQYEFPIPSGLDLEIPNLREKIDNVLDRVYAWCQTHDAVILAHGTNSISASENSAQRANPMFWKPVLDKYPRLRLNIGHFGGFEEYFAEPRVENWETQFGRLLADGNPNLVADLSFLSEAMGSNQSDEYRQVRELFNNFLAEFESSDNHLVYGSDWIMLGRAAGHEKYIESVEKFLTDAGVSDDQQENFFMRNAVRYLGLERGMPTRNRLDAYARKHNLDPDRFNFVDELSA